MKRLAPLHRPPGVLVPHFYIDPETKVFGCHARPWEDVLVEEMEAQMKQEPKNLRDFFKQEYLGEFMPKITPIDYVDTLSGRHVHYAKEDAETTRRCYDALRRMSPNFAVNRPSPRISGVKPDSIVLDSINWSELELRTLAAMPDYTKSELTFHIIIKNRTQESTCRPTTTEPPLPLPIFRPSPPPSLDCEARASAIPRLLADSVLKRRRSIGG